MKRKYCDVTDSETRHFLEGPLRMEERLEREQDCLANLKAMICCTTSHLSPTPSGSRNIHAREDLMVKKMELEKQIAKDAARLEDMKAEVILAIMTLDNPNEQNAIRYRFLEGLTNWETAEKMYVEPRSVQRYVQSGCQAMKLPDRYYKNRSNSDDGSAA